MRLCGAMVLVVAALMGSLAQAQDRLSLTGELDVRWVQATGPPSFLDGGLGALRFDSEHEGLRFGHALLASRLRITDLLTAHVVADAYGDHDRNFVDLSEAFIEARPFPSHAIRWSAKAGAFFMPVSLENRGPGGPSARKRKRAGSAPVATISAMSPWWERCTGGMIPLACCSRTVASRSPIGRRRCSVVWVGRRSTSTMKSIADRATTPD
jgi:hypothetical protein